jgi:ABC-2 type transport system permease protein
LILLFAAILTMRLVAEEKKLGTWELMLTVPIRDGEIVVGKFLGSLAVLCGMLVLTLYYPLLLILLGDPDLGPMATSYLGLLLIGSVSLAVGIFATTVTSNQIVAVVLAGGILYALWAIGLVGDIVPGGVGEVLSRFSLSGYFDDLARGVIDTQALVYYLSVTILFLYVSVRSIDAGRWRLVQSKARSGSIALAGLGTLVVAWVLDFVLPTSRIITWAIVAVGVGLILANALWEFRRVQGALSSKRGAFGIGTGVTLSLVAGVLLLANLVSTTVFHRFDFTGLEQFTLTTQTKEALGELAELEETVEVVAFHSDANPNVEGSAEVFAVNSFGLSLLQEYTSYTDKLDIRREDPELRPDLTRQYLGQGRLAQVASRLGVVLFRFEGRQMMVFGRQIQAEAENAFTSAILQVTGTRQRIVYFLSGHGEAGIAGDYSDAREGLRDNLFQVGELDLRTLGDLPVNTSAAVLAGPQLPLADAEIALLQRYLERGGRLMLLLNPNPQQELRDLVAEWWLSIEDGVVVDPAAHVTPNVDVPLVDGRRNAFQLDEAYFPGATVIGPRDGVPEETQVVPLAWTSPFSWQEREPLGGDEPTFDEDTDARGPLALGALVEAPLSADVAPADARSPQTRLVVMGDSDFASNQHFLNGNNSDLFLTAINWLGEGDDVISVDRKVLPVRRLVLSPEESRFLNLSSVGLLPLVLVVVAGWVWRRRR